MKLLIIKIDDDSIESNQDTADALASLLDSSRSLDDDHIDPDDLQEILAALPNDAIEVRQYNHRPDWEPGNPCPECGNASLSVMSLDKTMYASVDDVFEFIKKDDTLGSVVSIICPECMTHLAHVPYQILSD